MLMRESWGHSHWQEAACAFRDEVGYAQTLHLQSKLIDSYTLHLLCLWWCQRICDIPVIIAQCRRSQPHLMWGSLLLCLSLQGIGPSLLQCPQCQEICYSAKEPISFYTVLIKGFYFCSSCFWPWAEICAMSWVFLTSSHIGKRTQWFFCVLIHINICIYVHINITYNITCNNINELLSLE